MQPFPSVRDTLFADAPLEQWTKDSDSGEPWASFKSARDALQQGDKQRCIQILEDVVNRDGLESRQYAHGWYVLRQLGVKPAERTANDLLGVVVEVGMDRGLDLLAAYSDLKARYYNFAGGGVVWERLDTSLDAPIQQLLRAAEVVANKIAPWLQPKPPAPPTGNIRINVLTPGGLRFGQGPFQALASDPLGGPVITAATTLMQLMIKKTKK